MTQDYEPNPKYEEKKMDVLSGIYRVLQGIDEKVDAILDEIRHSPEMDREDYMADPYWYNHEENGYY